MKFAAVFPGQGSQHPGMGKELYDNFKAAKLTFEEASDSLKLDLKKLCFDGPESDLKLTQNTQPALLVTSTAAWRVFSEECGLKPSLAMGHSLGEYSALTAAEGLSLSDATQTVRIRGQAMQDAVPVGTGGMVAVLGLQDNEVVQMCAAYQQKARSELHIDHATVEAANFNSPGQVVISGHQKVLDFLKANFNAADFPGTRVKFIPLAVSAPFHCSLMAPAAKKLGAQLEKVKWNPSLKFPVIHNVDVSVNTDGLAITQKLFDQMTKPVLWHQSVHKAKEQGCQAIVEFGAGRVLAGLTKKIAPDLTTYNVDTLENLKATMSALKGS